MKLDYDEEYKKQIQNNIDQVLLDIDSPESFIKIKNWADKFGFSYNEVRQKIESDILFRCVFVKDPKKQNIYEKLALQYIMKIPNVQKAQKDGKTQILHGKPTEIQNPNGTHIDFQWYSMIENESTVCYAYQRYINGNGGNQSNQFNDIKNFICNCITPNNKPLKNIYFFSICDGSFFTEKKLQELYDLAPKNLKVLKTVELYHFLQSYVD